MQSDNIINSLVRTYFVPVFREIIREELQKRDSSTKELLDDGFLTAKESAEFIGDALQTFYGRTSRGEINTYGSGKKIFCKRSELIAWKEKQRTTSKEALTAEVREQVRGKKRAK